MEDSKWSKQKKSFSRAKWKLWAKKNDFRSGKNILRICLETLLQSLINRLKKLIKQGQFMEKILDAVLKKLKTEYLHASMKYLLKYQRQENLMIYFYGYAMLRINKTQ